MLSLIQPISRFLAVALLATGAVTLYSSLAGRRWAPCGVRLCQGPLPRAQEERSSPDRDLRIGQSVHGTSSSAALPGGVECPHGASTLHRQSNTPKDGAQSLRARAPCRWLTKFLFHFSMRQPLVQTFPSRRFLMRNVYPRACCQIQLPIRCQPRLRTEIPLPRRLVMLCPRH